MVKKFKKSVRWKFSHLGTFNVKKRSKQEDLGHCTQVVDNLEFFPITIQLYKKTVQQSEKNIMDYT